MSGRWDEQNTDDHRGFGSTKVILILMGIMILMWILFGFITTLPYEMNCESINEYIESNDFYELSSNEQQKYYNAQQTCIQDNIIVK